MASFILLMMLVTLLSSIIFVAVSFRINEQGQCFLTEGSGALRGAI